MTYNEALQAGIAELEKAQVPNAHFDAEELLLFATKMSRAIYLLSRRETVPEDLLEVYFSCIKRRCERVPLQHILGYQDFMGYSFKVNENVLCPRQDTESLVEKAYEILDEMFLRDGFSKFENVVPIRRSSENNAAGRKALDLCTGSGCIAICLDLYAKENGFPLSVTATDASEDALSVAKENASHHKADIRFLQGDLFDAAGDEKYDMIISNPPYIPKKVIEGLMPEVRDHEPHGALDGGEDGLYFYRRITSEAPAYLTERGYLICEIGFNQGKDVSEMLKSNGFMDVEVHKDLAGNDRIVLGHL
ncbi:MAG: peptide chain release factor N(5)-glutamine methyltransferase [Lachnospiraceae bacterium]|nr:peptide chain release factor N(5)-glutamine methyltransferase [Lachnospiraceae bacterium]